MSNPSRLQLALGGALLLTSRGRRPVPCPCSTCADACSSINEALEAHHAARGIKPAENKLVMVTRCPCWPSAWSGCWRPHQILRYQNSTSPELVDLRDWRPPRVQHRRSRPTTRTGEAISASRPCRTADGRARDPTSTLAAAGCRGCRRWRGLRGSLSGRSGISGSNTVRDLLAKSQSRS